MMREIKFRALFENEDKSKGFQYIEIKNHITGKESDMVQLSDWEQFTGLHDKNNQEIYANDIVKAKYDAENRVIKHGDFQGAIDCNFERLQENIEKIIILKTRWRGGDERILSREIYDYLKLFKDSISYGFYAESIKSKKQYVINSYSNEVIEIIGNIHKNPELLEARL